MQFVNKLTGAILEPATDDSAKLLQDSDAYEAVKPKAIKEAKDVKPKATKEAKAVTKNIEQKEE